MENILNTGTKLDVKWKYLTGEWFYEAKSRRHMDKIHGSDIILASMKQQRSPLGVSVRAALLTHGLFDARVPTLPCYSRVTPVLSQSLCDTNLGFPSCISRVSAYV